MPLIVWTADASGNIAYANDAWFETSGASREDGAPTFASVVHPEDLARFERAWTKGLAAGEPWFGDYRFGSRLDGRYRWHQVRVVRNTVDRARDGTTVVGTATDVDARWRAEHALQILLEVSETLAHAQDGESALAGAAARTVPLLGDACFADLYTPVSY